MRFLMEVKIPNGKFNAAVLDGSAGAKMGRILEANKPEAAYFTDQDGMRCGMLIVDMPDASKIPALAEPWFLLFDAQVSFKLVMTPEDLKKSGLDEIGKKWK